MTFDKDRVVTRYPEFEQHVNGLLAALRDGWHGVAHRTPPMLDGSLVAACSTRDDAQIVSTVCSAIQTDEAYTSSYGRAVAVALRGHVPDGNARCRVCHGESWPCPVWTECYLWLSGALDPHTGLLVTEGSDHVEGEICWPQAGQLHRVTRCDCAKVAELRGTSPSPGHVTWSAFGRLESLATADVDWRIACLDSMLDLAPLTGCQTRELRVLELGTAMTHPSVLEPGSTFTIAARRLAHRYGQPFSAGCSVVSLSASVGGTDAHWAHEATPKNEREHIHYYNAPEPLDGLASEAPYDLVVHWNWVHRIPVELWKQCRGCLISPVLLDPGPHGMGVAFLSADESHTRPTAQVAFPAEDTSPPQKWEVAPAEIVESPDGYSVTCAADRRPPGAP